MSIARSILYNPSVNSLLRNVLRPFKFILPQSLKFPVSGKVKVTWNKNTQLYLNGNQTCFVSRLLFWEGIQGYDYPVIKIFSQIVKQSEVFIDIGANIGYYSILAAALNPKLRALAFEPSPGAFIFLSENIELNHLKNISPYKLALTNTEGKLTFYQHSNPKVKNLQEQLGGSSSLVLDEENKDQFQSIEVDATTLSQFVQKNQINTIDIIKIDTEATEHLVIEGGFDVLEKFKPIIICEVLKNKIEKELETIFNRLGYKYFFVTDDGLIQTTSLNLSTYKEDVFFVHESKISRIEKYIIK
jgi:FkbM family methyltransferase